MMPRRTAAILSLSLLMSSVSPGAALGQSPAPEASKEAQATDKPVPLNKEGTVLLDAKNKTLIVETEVVFREGMLEMLLCKRHTKEHEAILAFEGHAYVLHAGLVALGMEPGKPVVFTPEYVAPSGPKLKVEIVWKDEKGETRREDARQWIRHSIHRYFGEPLEKLPAGLVLPEDADLRYDAVNKELSWYGPMSDAQRDELLALSEDAAFRKAVNVFHKKSRSRAMEAEWVFAGSGFAVDEASNRKVYLAESGDVICVANFPSAMVDVAAKSSAEGQESLLYEAWTERVPPVGTRVRLEISPAPKEAGEKPGKPGESPP